MKAIRVNQPGDAGQLQLADVAEPAVADGTGEPTAIVEVTLAGVNFIDVYHRTGRYPLPVPFTPGVEGVGTVRWRPESAADDLRVGQRVGWVLTPGSYAEVAAVPVSRLVPLPDGVDDDIACALLVQGLTAHYLAVDTYPVAPGDIVVVHAGAGGVGWLLTQFTTALGARVIATASTPAKRELCRVAGAEVAVDYDEVLAAVADISAGAGAHVVYDGVGAATFTTSLRLLRRRGMLAVYGAASGPVPPFDLTALMPGSPFLTRPSLADYAVTAAEVRGRAAAVLAAHLAGDLCPATPTRYPLADAMRVHEDLEARRTTGKVVLEVARPAARG